MTRPQLRRFRGVVIPTATHPEIRRLKRSDVQPSLHGTKTWNSSRLVIDYLHRERPQPHVRVLDVGCGWGIAGVWCARVLGSDVTSMDADPGVFPYLRVVAALNGVDSRARRARFDQLTTRELSDYDLLIGADICFWDDMVDPLANLVRRALRAGVSRILLGDPERSPFLAMADRCLDRHGGELLEWRTGGRSGARGVLLHIDNR